MDFNQTLELLEKNCIQNAEEEGYECGFTGGKKSECPYEKFTEKEAKNAWLKGYSQGKEDKTTSFGRGMQETLSPQELLKLRDPVFKQQAIQAALRKKNKKLTGNQVADIDDTGKLIIRNKLDQQTAIKIGQTKIR